MQTKIFIEFSCLVTSIIEFFLIFFTHCSEPLKPEEQHLLSENQTGSNL